MSTTLDADPNRLIDVASQLPREQFERFLCQVAARRRGANTPSPRESELLQRISDGMPPEVWNAYQELVEKKERGELTTEDEEEIAGVVDHLENYLADRVRHIAELAGLRNQSASEVMRSLELESGDE